MPLDLDLRWSLDHPDLLVGVARVDLPPSGAAPAELTAWLDHQIATVPDPPEATRQAIRQLLKRHGFKATGRNKPACEYIAAARREDTFPRILPPVDVVNALALETGWPNSVLDLDLALAASPERALEVRLGAPDERYVFNPSGQVIDIENLFVVGAVGGPSLANPVKDAMTAKLRPESRRLVAFFYTSRAVASCAAVQEVAERFAAALGGGYTSALNGPSV